MGQKPATKVLLIGWDAADWQVINPLIDQGKMPSLERFVNQGVMGRLASLKPSLSPMLWTSIATGKRPFKHGIHGFTEPDPHGGGIRPVSTFSRTAKAVWNILNQRGFRSNVIGWWPSHPAEPVNGIMVSNRYQRAGAPMDKPWPVLPGTVHPRRLTEHIAGLRIHPEELTAEQILPFVPDAARIDQEKDKRLESVRRILADCASVHACATAVMQLEPWDFMAVYYDGIDHFGHGFMKYHPPRQPHISEQDFEMYKGVVEGGYRFHDMMLEVLLKLAGEDTVVILVSDHGFRPDHLRPAQIPFEPAGPAAEHGPYGIIAMKGPGVRRDDLVFGATLLDVAPTVLSLFDLPVGRDMDGKPLVQCFEKPPTIDTIASWEEVAGDDGRHPPDSRLDPTESRQALRQLIDLGYIEDPGNDSEKAVEQAIREARYNLAVSYLDAHRHLDALPILEDLWSAWPDELRFANHLANCYQELDQTRAYRHLVEEIIATQERLAEEARAKLRRQAAGEDRQENPTPEAIRETARLRSLSRPKKGWQAYLRGMGYFQEGRYEKALAQLQRAEQDQRRRPEFHLRLGMVYLRMKQWHKAEQAFSSALEKDEHNAEAYYGLSRSLLPQRRNREAAENALTAVGLLYHFPQAHTTLGIAMHRLGDLENAIQALKVAILQNPNNIEAHQRLAYIYRFRLDDHRQAEHHKRSIREIRGAVRSRKQMVRERVRARTAGERSRPEKTSPEAASRRPVESRQSAIDTRPAGLARQRSRPAPDPEGGPITIVSGLPRSGTSLLMQMLAAGGYPCLTDDHRPADANNPRGYFEFEKVKHLRTDASWLPAAQGRAVKIIAQLLPHLRPGFQYRVMFMDRPLDEIVTSQQVMLERRARSGTDLTDQQLKNIYAAQLRQIDEMLQRRNIPMLKIAFHEILEQGWETAGTISGFLGEDLDLSAMEGVIDPRLCHHRTV